MDCSNFHPEQVERMLAMLMRQRDYLTRLIERMRVRRFPPDDPVYRAALGALEKCSNLCVVLAKCRRQDGDPPPQYDTIMTQKPWGG